MARNFNKIKKIGLLTSLLILATVIVGGTFAYLATKTTDVINTFTPANVPIEVVEKFDGKTKTDVKIQNDGNIPAYIRATYVVNWATETGEIWGTPPTAAEYTIDVNTDQWVKHSDGYYYYVTGAVDPEDQTDNFINSCSLEDDVNPPESGYYLRVDILAQSVQSEPADAIEELWGVKIANGTVTAK